MSGPQINRANWTKERILAFRKFVSGDEDAKFRGVKKNGIPYKNAVRVKALVARHSTYSFSLDRKKQLVATGGGFGPRKILTDDQVQRTAIYLFRHKGAGVGKTPSIYNYMKTKYINVSYKKVEKAIQSLAAYQKYSARHVKKPAVRKVIVSEAPGKEIDTDVMYFSTQYYMPSHNEGFGALAVVVDRFSGYIGIMPLLHKTRAEIKVQSAMIVGDRTQRIITRSGFPRYRGGTIFHDDGVEYSTDFGHKMEEIGYNDVVISKAAGAPSPHAEGAVGIIRRLVNTKLTSGGQRPAKKTKGQSWWPMVKGLVRTYNEMPMTDARAPYSPNQIIKLPTGKRRAMVAAMRKAGQKRVDKAPGRMIVAEGRPAKVPKTLLILKVGDRVRYAVEHIRKTGANKRPFPKQRWSGKVHRVSRVIPRMLGFAMYALAGLPRQRFEREDLQLIEGTAHDRDTSEPGESERKSRLKRPRSLG